MEGDGRCLLSNPTVVEFAIVCGFASVGSFNVLEHIADCWPCAEKAILFFETENPRRLKQAAISDAAVVHFIEASQRVAA